MQQVKHNTFLTAHNH